MTAVQAHGPYWVVRLAAALIAFGMLGGCVSPRLARDCKVPRNSPAELDDISKQACSGDKSALLVLGERAELGQGIALDLNRARRLYQAAATDSGGPMFVYIPAAGSVPQRVERLETPRVAGLDAARIRLRHLAQTTNLDPRSKDPSEPAGRASMTNSETDAMMERKDGSAQPTLRDRVLPLITGLLPSVEEMGRRLGVSFAEVRTAPDGLVTYTGRSANGDIAVETFFQSDAEAQVRASLQIKVSPPRKGEPCRLALSELERTLLPGGWKSISDIDFVLRVKTFETTGLRLQIEHGPSAIDDERCISQIRYFQLAL